MPDKCKADLDHVNAIATSARVDAGTWGVIVRQNGSCTNHPDYRGMLYVLTRNGKPGMQMLPALAQQLPERLLAAADVGPNVMIRHKVAGSWFKIRRGTMTADTARSLASRIAAAVLG